jgi:hypothetical protein
MRGHEHAPFKLGATPSTSIRPTIAHPIRASGE